MLKRLLLITGTVTNKIQRHEYKKKKYKKINFLKLTNVSSNKKIYLSSEKRVSDSENRIQVFDFN